MSTGLSGGSIHAILQGKQIPTKPYLQALSKKAENVVEWALSDGFHLHKVTFPKERIQSAQPQLLPFCIIQLEKYEVHWPVHGDPELTVISYRLAAPPQSPLGRPKLYIGSGSFVRSFARQQQLKLQQQHPQHPPGYQEMPAAKDRELAAQRFLVRINEITSKIFSGKPTSSVVVDLESLALKYVEHINSLARQWHSLPPPSDSSSSSSSSSSSDIS